MDFRTYPATSRMITVNGSSRCGRQSEGHPTRGHEQVVRFNGVATFQPRNDSRTSRPCHTLPSFNGAATFQPRNACFAHNSRIAPATASMGPRLFSRGMTRSAGRLCPAMAASMGPRLFSRGMAFPAGAAPWRTSGFNGAATFQPRNDHRLKLLTRLYLASMGPRLFSRGMWKTP